MSACLRTHRRGRIAHEATETLILGAGAAGLGAARALAQHRSKFQVLEAAPNVGGLAQTDQVGGFSFDRTGHVLHFRDPELRHEFGQAVRLETIARRAAVVLDGALVPYPLQYNLWALHSPELARSVIDELRQAAGAPRADADSFAAALLSTWGPSLVSAFLRPYNEKLWGRQLEELPADCAGDYLPKADLQLAERGAWTEVSYDGYNGSFSYPVSGRFGEIMEALASPVRAAVRLHRVVSDVDLLRRRVRTADGETLGYDRLISTIPLPRLLELADLDPQPDLCTATQLVNMRIGVRGVMRTPLHWIYVPDPTLPFHRIGFPHNLNPATCPVGCASVSVEYTAPASGQRLSSQEIASAALECVSGLRLLDVEDVLVVDEYPIAPAYVVNRAPGRPEFEEIVGDLKQHGVRLAGRFGAWDYMSVEEAYASGRDAVAGGSPTEELFATTASPG